MQSLSCTNVQLFNQLIAAGYTDTELEFIFNVYKYCSELSYGFQSSGKPFITHLIRTSSILVMLKTDISVIAAGLIHSAYEFTDFGDGSRGISTWKREELRQKVGEIVEIYVMKYCTLTWNDATIPTIYHTIKELDTIDKNVILIRLANELEQALDLEYLYSSNSEQLIQQIKKCETMLIEMSNLLGYPLLGEQLDIAFQNILNNSDSKIFKKLEDSQFFSDLSGRLSLKYLLKQRLKLWIFNRKIMISK